VHKYSSHQKCKELRKGPLAGLLIVCRVGCHRSAALVALWILASCNIEHSAEAVETYMRTLRTCVNLRTAKDARHATGMQFIEAVGQAARQSLQNRPALARCISILQEPLPTWRFQYLWRTRFFASKATRVVSWCSSLALDVAPHLALPPGFHLLYCTSCFRPVSTYALRRLLYCND
jgi:hypothetical protein